MSKARVNRLRKNGKMANIFEIWLHKREVESDGQRRRVFFNDKDSKTAIYIANKVAGVLERDENISGDSELER